MSSLRIGLFCAGLSAVLFFSSTSSAGLSANLGYQNPVETSIGANLLYTWTDLAVEVGIGFLGSGHNSQNKSSVNLGGDVDFKYMFLGGSFRPFLQGGTFWDFATTLSANDLSIGNRFFGGAGIFIFGSGVYSYASYNTGPPGWFLQAGLGFDL